MITLKDEPNLFIAQSGALFCFQQVDGGVPEEIFARPSVIVHAEDIKKGRFASAGWPHDRDEIALGYIQIDIAEDVKELSFGQRINSFDMLKLDHCLRFHS